MKEELNSTAGEHSGASPCSASFADMKWLDGLDWGWINKAAQAVACSGNKKEYALEVLNMAANNPPLAYCERGMFRAIKFPDGRIDLMCIVADPYFEPNK
jgi:hypothetical protein